MSSSVARAYKALLEHIGIDILEFHVSCSCPNPKKTFNNYNCMVCGKLLQEDDIPKVKDFPEGNRCACPQPYTSEFTAQLICATCNKYHRHDKYLTQHYNTWCYLMDKANTELLNGALNMYKVLRFK